MLSVDLRQDDKSIARSITLLCAKYGPVVSLKVHRKPSAFVLAEMRSHREAMELAAKIGGSMFGTCVLIHLQQVAVVPAM